MTRPPDAGRPRRRVLLVDDHPLVVEGLTKLIEQEPDLCVCGDATDPEAALAALARDRPDAVVLDLSLLGGSGLDLLNRMRDLPHPPPVLVLSMYDEATYAERAIRAGALGYVMKSETSGKIVEGLRRVLRGELFISEAMAARVAGKFFGSRSAGVASPIEHLSNRELEIFRRMGLGQETRQIAVDLHISIKTVQTHCSHIKDKLGIENATILMREAVRWVEGGQASGSS